MTKIKPFKELLKKELKWNANEVKTFENELKEHFGKIVVSKYENTKSDGSRARGALIPMNLITIFLIHNNIINSSLDNNEIYPSVRRIFLGESHIANLEKDLNNFDKFYRDFRGYQKQNKLFETNKFFKEHLKGGIDKIKEKHPYIFLNLS